MSEVESAESVEKGENRGDDNIVSFQAFLEKAHPSLTKVVPDVWQTQVTLNAANRRRLTYPQIRLYCSICAGERNFRCLTDDAFGWNTTIANVHPLYTCGDCRDQVKHYALHLTFTDAGGAKVYKYGEIPPFGIPVPNRVLRLFGNADAKLFLKGRQCEDQGFGIAASAYYRRVVENHRNDLFDEIIKVSETVGAPAELIDELKAAKKEISFAKSIEKIKTGLPQGLLIDGHNPLNALHGALSEMLHNESDEDCLQNAQAIRVVLSDLVERIAMLKQDNKQLSDAVQRLLAKRKGATN
ncbi:hypothetical protein [Rhizobium ruizarguesonis]|uniref:hypothetical protein n=1 Tax=Rhizobium ruizarguesonis TaxID=2081791 RepID=UPI001031290D|nr:hypothetical protein [Rhizobium ruizarguesonis]TBA25995.1 hypothetical protein ELH61_09395 [Rhizobium ruizarguesonis]